MLVPRDVLQLLQISSFMSCSISLYETQRKKEDLIDDTGEQEWLPWTFSRGF